MRAGRPQPAAEPTTFTVAAVKSSSDLERCHDDGRWFAAAPGRVVRIRPVCRCERRLLLRGAGVACAPGTTIVVERLASGVHRKRVVAVGGGAS